MWPTKLISLLGNGSQCRGKNAEWEYCSSEQFQTQANGPVQTMPSGSLEELADGGSGSCVLLVTVYLVMLCSVRGLSFQGPGGCARKWPWSQMMSHAVEGDWKFLKYSRHLRERCQVHFRCHRTEYLSPLDEAPRCSRAHQLGSPVGLKITEKGRIRHGALACSITIETSDQPEGGW